MEHNEKLSTSEETRVTYQKRIWYLDPKTGDLKQRIQTWSVSPDDEDDWDLDDPTDLPGPNLGDEDKVPKLTSKKLGRPPGSKNRRGTRVSRKTREPVKKL